MSQVERQLTEIYIAAHSFFSMFCPRQENQLIASYAISSPGPQAKSKH
jgi:hypothetical protein